jgi:hypothetical protein
MMLVQFLRDVIIVVAALAALIAIAFYPAQESDGSSRAKPALETRAAAASMRSDRIKAPPHPTERVDSGASAIEGTQRDAGCTSHG